jgi:hypothetical protein
MGIYQRLINRGAGIFEEVPEAIAAHFVVIDGQAVRLSTEICKITGNLSVYLVESRRYIRIARLKITEDIAE